MLLKAFFLAMVVASNQSPGPSAAPPIAFDPPAGWSEEPPPQSVGIGRLWVPRRTQSPGETLVLITFQNDAAQTLRGAVDELLSEELADGRTMIASKQHDTCRGKMPGWDVELRVGAPPLPLQLYHVSLSRGQAFAFMDTRRPGSSISSEVATTIESICPSAPS